MTNNEYRCKLYHKTTWFETLSSVRLVIMVTLVANYITKLRGLKPLCRIMLSLRYYKLQIISQNYVV